MRRAFVVIVLAVVAASACQPPTFDLVTTPPTAPGQGRTCLMALNSGAIAGDIRDPSFVWLVQAGGRRVDLRWPFGLSVRFSPVAEVISLTGGVIVRDGDRVELGGGMVKGLFEICTVNGRDPLAGA